MSMFEMLKATIRVYWSEEFEANVWMLQLYIFLWMMLSLN